MKKRLLITSIVMMLVVAVALSTATYAWFTSNASVTASTVTMTAGVSESSALGIAWVAGSGSGATFNSTYQINIDPYVYSGALQPAAPSALENAEPTFYTATIDAQGKFNSAPVEHAVFRFANMAPTASSETGYSNLIHIANLAASGSKTVTLSASILPHAFTAVNTEGEAVDTTTYDYYDADKVLIASPSGTVNSGYKVAKNTDGSALVRIAVFEVTGGSSYTYKGCISKTAGTDNTAVGPITSGTTTAASLMTVSTTTTIDLGSHAAQVDRAYAIYVWLDGQAFNEAESNKTADVVLTFTAA